MERLHQIEEEHERAKMIKETIRRLGNKPSWVKDYLKCLDYMDKDIDRQLGDLKKITISLRIINTVAELNLHTTNPELPFLFQKVRR
jgi:hypothetical protein